MAKPCELCHGQGNHITCPLCALDYANLCRWRDQGAQGDPPPPARIEDLPEDDRVYPRLQEGAVQTFKIPDILKHPMPAIAPAPGVLVAEPDDLRARAQRVVDLRYDKKAEWDELSEAIRELAEVLERPVQPLPKPEEMVKLERDCERLRELLASTQAQLHRTQEWRDRLEAKLADLREWGIRHHMITADEMAKKIDADATGYVRAHVVSNTYKFTKEPTPEEWYEAEVRSKERMEPGPCLIVPVTP